MPQVFDAHFDFHYRSDAPGRPRCEGSGRTLQVAIHRAVVELEGGAPELGSEVEVSLDRAPGRSVEIHGVVQACDGPRVALRFPRFTPEVGQVLAEASRRRS